MPGTSLPVSLGLYRAGAGLVTLPGVSQCVCGIGAVSHPALGSARCLAELSSHLYSSVPSINLSGCKYESGESQGSLQPSSPHPQALQLLAPTSHWFYCCQ